MTSSARLFAIGALVIALAGCAPEGVTAAAGPPPTPDMVWTAKVSGAGTGLILAPPGGDPVFSLACVRGTREVLAIVETVKPIGSEDRLSLGFGDLIVAFVVKPQALKEGRILEAGAKIQPELLAAIRTAAEIRGSYGATRIGPYPAPPKALVDPFVARCGPLI